MPAYYGRQRRARHTRRRQPAYALMMNALSHRSRPATPAPTISSRDYLRPAAILAISRKYRAVAMSRMVDEELKHTGMLLAAAASACVTSPRCRDG